MPILYDWQHSSKSGNTGEILTDSVNGMTFCSQLRKNEVCKWGTSEGGTLKNKTCVLSLSFFLHHSYLSLHP